MMRRKLSLGGLVGLVIVLAGFLIGSRPLGDNSFLTHLATGRIIWDTHHVPTHDPYTFTVAGRAWVVQSWLASVVFAAGDHLGGFRAIMMLVGAAAATLAFLVWRLTSPAQSLVGRLAIAALVVGVGNSYWVERPLLFGLLAFAIVLLAADGRVKPLWLVPTMWFWVNVHGSFPLGLVALGVLALGRRLDRGDPRVELAALKWATIGVAVGAVNPVGPRLLVFPVELLSKQAVLRNIIEWQAPRFTGISERIFLLEVIVAIAALVRRPQWRSALPLMVFLTAALLGARNIVIASLVFVPGLAAGFSGLGSLDGRERRSMFRPLAATLSAGAIIVAIVQVNDPLLRVRNAYPVRAVDRAEALGLIGSDEHLVTEDFVGNYLEFRYGAGVHSFIDDRYDMFPKALVDDSSTLLRGGSGWQSILDGYHADAVLWEVQKPLAELVQISPGWRIVYVDAKWMLAVRR